MLKNTCFISEQEKDARARTEHRDLVFHLIFMNGRSLICQNELIQSYTEMQGLISLKGHSFALFTIFTVQAKKNLQLYFLTLIMFFDDVSLMKTQCCFMTLQ